VTRITTIWEGTSGLAADHFEPSRQRLKHSPRGYHSLVLRANPNPKNPRRPPRMNNLHHVQAERDPLAALGRKPRHSDRLSRPSGCSSEPRIILAPFRVDPLNRGRGVGSKCCPVSGRSSPAPRNHRHLFNRGHFEDDPAPVPAGIRGMALIQIASIHLGKPLTAAAGSASDSAISIADLVVDPDQSTDYILKARHP
jgi:hypothetical protein